VGGVLVGFFAVFALERRGLAFGVGVVNAGNAAVGRGGLRVLMNC